MEVSYIEVQLYNYTHNCNDLAHTTFMFVFNIQVMKKKKQNKIKQKQTKKRSRNLVS